MPKELTTQQLLDLMAEFERTTKQRIEALEAENADLRAKLADLTLAWRSFATSSAFRITPPPS